MWWWVAAAAIAGELPSVSWDGAPEVGQTWYAAGSGVNLRAAASTTADVAGQLPLGAEVVVTAVDDASLTVGERTAPWVAVRAGDVTGHVWAGALTPVSAVRDLGGDTAPERVVVAWRADRHLVVRATPASSGPEVAAEELDLGMFGDIDGPLDRAEITWTSAGETGVPLLKVTVPGREMCGSGTSRRYVAWTGKTVSLALEVDDWADAPVYTTDEATFDPVARRVTVVNRQSEDGETEEVTTTVRAWDGATFAVVGTPKVTRE